MSVTASLENLSLKEGGGASIALRDVLCAEDTNVNRLVVSQLLKTWDVVFVGTGQAAYDAVLGQMFPRINIRDDQTQEDGPYKFKVLVLDFTMSPGESDMVKGGLKQQRKSDSMRKSTVFLLSLFLAIHQTLFQKMKE